ncbi:hypothetical protein NL108_018526 [Boleophthalmus pectinirostris]|nr:hypothetical protein NL108_018526 [Boleophthalmus pectinirostris]
MLKIRYGSVSGAQIQVSWVTFEKIGSVPFRLSIKDQIQEHRDKKSDLGHFRQQSERIVPPVCPGSPPPPVGHEHLLRDTSRRHQNRRPPLRRSSPRGGAAALLRAPSSVSEGDARTPCGGNSFVSLVSWIWSFGS